MSQLQTAPSTTRARGRRNAIIGILLIVGLLIVFRDTALVHALGSLVLALVHLVGAIFGLLGRLVGISAA